ncbi:MAG: putative bifunctional diguanylate cyclase/phosphodiesterase [Bacillota bacterium]
MNLILNLSKVLTMIKSFIGFITNTPDTFWLGLILGITVLFLLGIGLLLKSRKNTLKFYQEMLYDDPLTTMKNVNYLRQNFNNILIAFDKDVSMYYLNIDNFKNYNDLLGHKLADQLLIHIGNRIKKLIKPYDTVYRMHSDQFIILYPSHADNQNRFSEKLLSVLKDPYEVGVHTIKLTVSIGRYAIHKSNPRFNESLLRSELALQEAKLLGKDQIVYYSSGIKRRNHDAFTTYRLIKDALKDNGFYLEYQPIISPKTEKMVGVEALIRAKNANKFNAEDVIAYAEKYHLIEEIDHFVVREALAAFKRFIDGDCPLDFISINISTTEIHNDDFINYIVDEAKALNINPNQVTIEFTETHRPEDFMKEANFIKTLQAYGFKVAIDDFGSGYSSMIRLSQNQLDKIKIDRSFITGISDNKSNQKIVEAIINLSKTFGLEIIAEGVETKADYQYIKSKNIEYIQGYYFSKALSESVCMTTIKK